MPVDEKKFQQFKNGLNRSQGKAPSPRPSDEEEEEDEKKKGKGKASSLLSNAAKKAKEILGIE